MDQKAKNFLYLPLKSYSMKNIVQLLAWASGGIGMILMLLGSIAALNNNHFLGHFWSSYFYPSYTFIVLGIFFFLAKMAQKDKA
jgi:hypothetical protein